MCCRLGLGAVARRPGAGGAMPLAGPAGRLRCALDAGRTECECEIRGAVDTGVGKNIGPDGDFFLRRGKFLVSMIVKAGLNHAPRA